MTASLSEVNMKIQSLKLKYFKKFRNPPVFDFTDPETGLARDMIVLVGMNGAGKTSLLQAIAATLGVAVGRFDKLSDLDWFGFNHELLGANWGQFDPEVDMKVQFSSSELQAIRDFNDKLKKKCDRQIIMISCVMDENRLSMVLIRFGFSLPGLKNRRKRLGSKNISSFEAGGWQFSHERPHLSTPPGRSGGRRHGSLESKVLQAGSANIFRE